MGEQVFLSICIPAYKRIDFLERLFKSISIQTFRDFEVIVTDDSPDDSVSMLCNQYGKLFALFYHRNAQVLGSPENWDEAIRRSRGGWIKIMHDDDWFSGADSLSIFADAIRSNPASSFFYSAYRSVMVSTGSTMLMIPSYWRRRQLAKSALTLISKNIIGPPSVTVFKSARRYYFDKNLRWLVDIDFYASILPGSNAVYIDQPIVDIGMSELQITQQSFRDRSVEIPEHIYIMKKHGFGHLKNVIVYDAWWRLIRNLGITKRSELDVYVQGEPLPKAIHSMVSWQNRITPGLLKIGAFSKILMLINYFSNRITIAGN